MSILQSNESHITINADGANKEVRFQNNGTQNMVLDSSGNVGIGTSSPVTDLEIQTSGAHGLNLYSNTNESARLFFTNDTSSETWCINQSSGNLLFRQGGSAGASSGDAKVSINSSGYVGIGTTSPAYELEVKGDASAIQVSSADYDVALLGRRASSGPDLDKGYLRLRDTGVTKVSIDSAGNTYFNGGNVGIGTNSPDTYSLGSAFTVLGINPSSGDGVINLIGQTSGYMQFGTSTVRKASIHSNSASDLVFTLNASNSGTTLTERMRILNDGGITFNGDTATANALDDYEEGTFTYAFAPASGTINTRSGYTKGFYTKVGRLVNILIRYETNSISSPSGDLYITGLPFTSAANPTDGSNHQLFPIVLRDATGVSNISNAFVNLPTSGNTLRFLYVNSSATISSFDASYVSSSFQGTIAFSYVT